MRRRPMLPESRRDVALRPVPTRTFDGRVETLPSGIIGAAGNQRQFEIFAGATTAIEHITLHAVADLAIVEGENVQQFDRVDTPPADTVGFPQALAALATNGVLASIPINVSGYAHVTWEADYDDVIGGTLTVEVTRGGATLSRDSFSGSGDRFLPEAAWVWLEAGDAVEVVLDSDGATTQPRGRVQIGIWEYAASTAPPAGTPADLVGFEHGEGVTDPIAGTVAGHLLLALVVSHNNSNGGSINTPAGWTFVERVVNSSGDQQPVDLFYRVADGTETEYGTWTNSGLGAGRRWVGVANVGNADPGTIVTVTDSYSGGGPHDLELGTLGGTLWIYALSAYVDEGDDLERATLLAGPEPSANQLSGYWWQGDDGNPRVKEVGSESSIMGVGVSA